MPKLAEFLSRLYTGRAALFALVGTVLGMLMLFGLKLPENFEETVNRFIDVLLMFGVLMTGGSHLHTETPPERKGPASKTAAMLVVVLVAPALGACSSFMHFSDPTLEDLAADFCGEKASAHRADLEAEATRTGIGVAELIEIFTAACVLRFERASAGGEGEKAGLAAVRRKPALAGGS